MEDYSNMTVHYLENGRSIESWTHPRVTLTVLALKAGLSVEEVQQLLARSDDELQALANRIGQEFLPSRGFIE